jgi:hypothetical protein
MTIREEIQITDLEPSIEGGQDISYGVQIRGIDAKGNPGPWSEKFIFTSPSQIPSLESFNYVEGEAGWRFDNDGSFEANGGTLRGTLSSGNYITGQSGWILTNDGNVEFSTGVFRGALQIGSNTFRVDPSGNLSIGGSSPATAPFRVNTNGQIEAMSISGNFIEAGTIAANRIVANSITANQIANSTITGSKIVGGTITGALIANSTITGALIANSAITGALIANSTITGAKIANATISGLNITDGGVNTVQLAAGAVDRFRIADGEVIREKVPLLAINAARISDLSVDKLTGNTITGFNINCLSFTALDLTIGNTVISGIANSVQSQRVVATGSGTGFSGALRAGNAPAVASTSSTAARFDTAGALRPLSSSRKFKKDIVDAPVYHEVLNLRPVHYKMIAEDTSSIDYGLIAEEVADFNIPGLISRDAEGQPRAVNYELIGLLLVDHVKSLEKRVQELEDNYAK